MNCTYFQENWLLEPLKHLLTIPLSDYTNKVKVSNLAILAHFLFLFF